jgi:hypothetical protein
MTRSGAGGIVDEAARGRSGGATEIPLSSRRRSVLVIKFVVSKRNRRKKEEKTNGVSFVGSPAASDIMSSRIRCVEVFLEVEIRL